jgi:hypothetical protein
MDAPELEEPGARIFDRLGITTLGLSLEEENSCEDEFDEKFCELTIRLIPFFSITVTFDVSFITPGLHANAVAAPDIPVIVCLAI